MKKLNLHALSPYTGIFITTIVVIIFYCSYEFSPYIENYLNTDKLEITKLTLQFIGGLLIMYGLILNYRRTEALENQVRIQEHSLDIDRIQKAIQQLSSPNEVEKLAGVITIGKIAENSIGSDPHTFNLAIEILVSIFTKTKANSIPEYKKIAIDYLLNKNNIVCQKRVKLKKHITISYNLLHLEYGDLYEYTTFSGCEISFKKNVRFEYCTFNEHCKIIMPKTDSKVPRTKPLNLTLLKCCNIHDSILRNKDSSRYIILEKCNITLLHMASSYNIKLINSTVTQAIITSCTLSNFSFKNSTIFLLGSNHPKKELERLILESSNPELVKFSKAQPG